MNKAVIVALLFCLTSFTGCIGEDDNLNDSSLVPVSNLDEEDISQKFANLTSKYESLASDLSELAKNYDTALSQNNQLHNEIRDAAVELELIRNDNDQMNSTIIDQEQELDTLRSLLETSNNELDEMHDNFTRLQSDFDDVGLELDQYIDDFGFLQADYSALNYNFTMLQSNFNELSEHYDSMKEEFDEWKTYQSIMEWDIAGECPTEVALSYSSGIDNGDNDGEAGNNELEEGEIDHSASVCKPGINSLFSSTGYINYLTEFNGNFYFAYEGSSDQGNELWVSDYYGNLELLKDINPGEADSYPWITGKTDDLLFFRASNSISGYELWATDGTESGTNLVKDINQGTDSGFYGYNGFSFFNDKFYFGGNNGTTGEELWVTDGTANGTYMIKEIRGEDENGNNYGSSPSGFTVIGDLMYFFADDGTHGSEPWVTDGTANGTYMLKDIREGTGSSSYGCDIECDSSFFPFVKFNDMIYFAADDGTHGSELWATDGTENGTYMIKDIREEDDNGNNYGGVSCYYSTCFFEFADKLWFNAHDGVHGSELWYTDGTEEGTLMFADIRDGSDSSSPRMETIFVLDEYMYFLANDGSDDDIFMTDGKQMLMSLHISEDAVYYYNTAGFNGYIYMSLHTPSNGYELWKTDGTSDGTEIVHEFRAGTASGSPGQFIVHDEIMYMIAYASSSNNQEMFVYAPNYYEF